MGLQSIGRACVKVKMTVVNGAGWSLLKFEALAGGQVGWYIFSDLKTSHSKNRRSNKKTFHPRLWTGHRRLAMAIGYLKYKAALFSLIAWHVTEVLGEQLIYIWTSIPHIMSPWWGTRGIQMNCRICLGNCVLNLCPYFVSALHTSVYFVSNTPNRFYCHGL